VAVNGVRQPGEEIDCLATVGAGEPVRSFLRLPSQEDAGRLRMVETGGILFGAEHELGPVTLSVLEGLDPTPACLPRCYVSGLRLNMPVTAAFPAELAVNSAVIGSEDADARYSELSISTHAGVWFADRETTSLQEIAAHSGARAERASVPFGRHRLQLFEIATIDNSGEEAEVKIKWWLELVLSGPAKTLEEWKAMVMPSLALISFCLDRPLMPERIHTIVGTRVIDYHLRWRENSAPSHRGGLLTLDGLKDRFTDVAAAWAAIHEREPELLRAVVEYQLRRDARIPGDRFLLVARCLELYFGFGDRFETVMRPSAEHKELVERVVGSLPAGIAEREGEWIEKLLANANRASLLDQMRRILGSFGGEVLRFCGIPADREEFARTVRDARNHLTHPSSDPRERVPEGRELVVLEHRLWFLLRACLLREMGFREPEIVEVLARAGQSYYLIRG
jgi:hypothetical protein